MLVPFENLCHNNQFMSRFVYITLAIIFSFVFSNAEVWKADKFWTDETSTEFATWMQKEWRKDFFSRKKLSDGSPNIFYGLRLDCADTVYSSKIIFSYLHKYHFSINDPTGGKKLITNEMNRWDNLPEAKRVTAFLKLMYNLVSTKSLPGDTYPVALTSNSISPGMLILTTKKNHHSWTIKNIFDTGIPHLVFNSTVGAYSSLNLQERKSWPNGEWVFEDDNTPTGSAGIRNWKPEAYISEPAWKVPGYSEDQYKQKPSLWRKNLETLLKIKDESTDGKLKRLLENVCNDIKQRHDAVKEASQFILDNKINCLNEADFDTYSTPSRDKRLADEFISLREAYQDALKTKDLNEVKLSNQLNKIFPNPELKISEENKVMQSLAIDENSICSTVYHSYNEGTNKTIDMAELKRRLFNKTLSSNPNDPEEVRFGEKRPVKNSCPSWGSLELTWNE